jgi:endonuclease/exonuclease/phosphatase family metal-dependent hydrolase
MKYLAYALSVMVLVVVLVIAWAWQTVVWYPPVVQVTPSCDRIAAPWPDAGAQTAHNSAAKPATLTVMSFNVQYMAGKNYVFFYDVEGGPDTRPSLGDVEITLDRVAKVIAAENPDVVMLQEINDEHDSRSHFVNQVTALQQRLGELAYPCQASAHYWQAGLVLHPKVLGAVSMKLVTLSRYPLTEARRYQLPLMANDPLTQRFYFQRALLEAWIATESGTPIALLNTHFDAWGEGSGLMQQQVATTKTLLDALNDQRIPWILGGDLNLLPDDGDRQWQALTREHGSSYEQQTALAALSTRYRSIPSLDALTGEQAQRWYTYYPNNPSVSGPDRTLDYVFYSDQWQLHKAYVRYRDTLDASDHLPVVGDFSLQAPPAPR